MNNKARNSKFRQRRTRRLLSLQRCFQKSHRVRLPQFLPTFFERHNVTFYSGKEHSVLVGHAVWHFDRHNNDTLDALSL